MITIRSNISLLPTAAITHALVFAQLKFSTTFISYFRINTAKFVPLRVLLYINMMNWNKNIRHTILIYFIFQERENVEMFRKSQPSEFELLKIHSQNTKFLYYKKNKSSWKKEKISCKKWNLQFYCCPSSKIFLDNVFIQKILCDIIYILIVTYFYR